MGIGSGFTKGLQELLVKVGDYLSPRRSGTAVPIFSGWTCEEWTSVYCLRIQGMTERLERSLCEMACTGILDAIGASTEGWKLLLLLLQSPRCLLLFASVAITRTYCTYP